MRPARRTITWIGLTLVGAAAAIWMFRPSALEVEVVAAARGSLRVTIDEPGITRLPRHVELSAPTSGRLAEALVRVGDSVTAGALVAELRPAPLDPSAQEQVRASASAATARRQESQALARQAEIALEEARRALGRAERLNAAGGIPARELESATAAVAMRTRELEAARARQRSAMQDERRALAAARGGGGEIATQDVVKLRAPMDGRVLRLFEFHDRVVPAGTPLVEIGDLSALEVVMDVLSRDAVSVAAGQGITLQLPSGDTVPGTVTRVEPAAFTRTSALGIAEQRVHVVARPLAFLPGVGDGFELPASIVLWEGNDVLAIPPSALVPTGEGWGVFVVRAGRARRQPIEIGQRGTRLLEVRRGIAAGDTIILHPDTRVLDGGRVRIRRGAAAPSVGSIP